MIITDQDIQEARAILGPRALSGALLEKAREIADRRWESSKPTEPYLPPIVILESERITATDLGPIVIEE
jgi:hypothetical protein